MLFQNYTIVFTRLHINTYYSLYITGNHTYQVFHTKNLHEGDGETFYTFCLYFKLIGIEHLTI